MIGKTVKARQNYAPPAALFMGEAVGAVVLVPARMAALSVRTCAPERGASGAAVEALRFSQGFPCRCSVAARSGAPSGLDWW